MQRYEIINLLIKKNGYKSYLEIGLDDPRGNFLLVNCENKESVDPYEIEQHTNLNMNISGGLNQLIIDNLTYRETSDEFFSHNKKKYDIIFVDGLHLEEQVGRDIINGLKCLNKGGKIVVHDCIPISEETQKEEIYPYCWNGTVWKAIPSLEKQHIKYSVVDTDCGCGIIDYYEYPELLYYPSKSELHWHDFQERGKEFMHIISENEFFEKYILQ